MEISRQEELLMSDLGMIRLLITKPQEELQDMVNRLVEGVMYHCRLK
jgi:hypothetical protein